MTDNKPKKSYAGLAISTSLLFGILAGAGGSDLLRVHPLQDELAETQASLDRKEAALEQAEAQLATFEVANDIAALYIKAGEISQKAAAFCATDVTQQYDGSVPQHIIDDAEEYTLSLVEQFSYHFRRDDFPVADRLAWLADLEDNGIHFMGTNLPRNVIAQFFDSPEYGKILAVDPFLLYAAEDRLLQDFVETLREVDFSMPGQVAALIKDSPVPGNDSTAIVTGTIGLDRVIVEDGDYRMPIDIATGPC